MGSFGGAPFAERGNGSLYPAWQYEANYTELEIPDGQSVIQVGGVKSGKLALDIRVTKAELDSLNTKVGQVASLSYSYGTFSAFLASVSDAREIVESGKYFATLNFIKR